MKKGKFGVTFSFYAALGFLFAMLGQTLMCALLLVFILLVEKDEWTAKLNLQALGLSLYWSVATLAVSVVRSLLSAMFSRFGFYYGISGFMSFVDIAVDVIFILWAYQAISNIKAGKEVKVPYVDQFVNYAYGIVTAQPQYVQQPVQPQNAQQPVQPQNMQQPVQPQNAQQPVQQPLNLQKPVQPQNAQNDTQAQ